MLGCGKMRFVGCCCCQKLQRIQESSLAPRCKPACKRLLCQTPILKMGCKGGTRSLGTNRFPRPDAAWEKIGISILNLYRTMFEIYHIKSFFRKLVKLIERDQVYSQKKSNIILVVLTQPKSPSSCYTRAPYCSVLRRNPRFKLSFCGK